MFTLDTDCQRLIKMRYLLRKGGISDVNDLETKTKQLVLDSATLKSIADDISKFKQKGTISRSSLGRWFDFYDKKSNISRSNLKAIANYILCDEWDDFTNQNAEDIEEKIIKEHNLKEGEKMVSVMGSKEDNNSFGLKRIISRNIEKGKIVEIIYGNNKLLKLKKLADTDRYLVKQSDSDVLSKGWSISIPVIFLGVNIIGLDVKENGITIKTYYKSSGTVKNIVKRTSMIWD